MTRSVAKPDVGLALFDAPAIAVRQPLADLAEAFSGAWLEEVVLADGRTLILKHLPHEGDWLTRATGGAGRLRRLWTSGSLERIRPRVDHTILDMRHANDGELVIMRDARAELHERHRWNRAASLRCRSSRSCTCVDGRNGDQRCREDGSGFEAC